MRPPTGVEVQGLPTARGSQDRLGTRGERGQHAGRTGQGSRRDPGITAILYGLRFGGPRRHVDVPHCGQRDPTTGPPQRPIPCPTDDSTRRHRLFHNLHTIRRVRGFFYGDNRKRHLAERWRCQGQQGRRGGVPTPVGTIPPTRSADAWSAPRPGGAPPRRKKTGGVLLPHERRRRAPRFVQRGKDNV